MFTTIARCLWLLLAIISFIGGIIGLMLPIIPQIPFFILCLYSIYSISKFSPRFHAWIKGTKLYQKYILKFKNMLPAKENTD